MCSRWLRRTLPRLEEKSRNTGSGFAVFIFEKVDDQYFSEKIRITEGDMIYRYISPETLTVEEQYNRIIANKPAQVH